MVAEIKWISKQDALPPFDMECEVLNATFDEQWTAWYDDYYQAFFLPDYFVPIEVTHWKPRLKVSSTNTKDSIKKQEPTYDGTVDLDDYEYCEWCY